MRRRGDVHVGGALLELQERGVESAQSVAVGHVRNHLTASPQMARGQAAPWPARARPSGRRCAGSPPPRANQARDADAQESHRRIELEVLEQPRPTARTRSGSLVALIQRPRAGVGAERAQADLERHRAPGAPLGGEAPADRVHQPIQGEVERRDIGDVGGKGGLAALRLSLSVGRPADGRRGRERARAARGPAAAPMPAPACGPGRPPDRPPSGRPAAASRSAVRSPTPGIRVAWRSPTASSIRSGSSTQKPSGFSRSEATLASSLLGAIPTEQTSPVAARTSPFSWRARAFGAGEPLRSR